MPRSAGALAQVVSAVLEVARPDVAAASAQRNSEKSEDQLPMDLCKMADSLDNTAPRLFKQKKYCHLKKKNNSTTTTTTTIRCNVQNVGG